MKAKKKANGRLIVRSAVKSGGASINHNRLVVRTGVKSGGASINHNRLVLVG